MDRKGGDLEAAYLAEAEKISDTFDVPLTTADAALRAGPPANGEELLTRLEL